MKIYAHLFTENLSEADVIFTYGMPHSLKHKLKQKLEKELKKGTKVISYTFKIAGWKPVVESKPSKDQIGIYVYEI